MRSPQRETWIEAMLELEISILKNGIATLWAIARLSQVVHHDNPLVV